MINWTEIASHLMIVAFFVAIVWIIDAAFNFSLKKRMINLGHINEDALKFISKPAQSKLENLKWALLFFFGGLGLVVLEFLPQRADESPLPYGVEAIFISIGFFVYYFIAQQKKMSSAG